MEATLTETISTQQHMADGGYTKIKIAENPAGPDLKWGPLYVAVNDYDAYLPRAAEVIVSNLILDSLFKAATQRPEIMVQPLQTYTAVQAHEERLLGNTPVFPAKATPSTVADSAKKGQR